MSALRRLGVPLGCRQFLGHLAAVCALVALVLLVIVITCRLFACGRCPCP